MDGLRKYLQFVIKMMEFLIGLMFGINIVKIYYDLRLKPEILLIQIIIAGNHI